MAVTGAWTVACQLPTCRPAVPARLRTTGPV